MKTGCRHNTETTAALRHDSLNFSQTSASKRSWPVSRTKGCQNSYRNSNICNILSQVREPNITIVVSLTSSPVCRSECSVSLCPYLASALILAARVSYYSLTFLTVLGVWPAFLHFPKHPCVLLYTMVRGLFLTKYFQTSEILTFFPILVSSCPYVHYRR